MSTLLTVLIALAFAFNVYASVLLVRSPRFERQQKRMQLALIWLLPVIGAILVWSLAHDAKAPMFSTDFSSGGSLGDGVIGADNCSSNDAGGGDGCGGGDGGGGGD